MHKAMRRILILIYLITVPPLLACYLSPLVSPATFWPLAFFGLLFPALIVIQFVFIVLFLVVRSSVRLAFHRKHLSDCRKGENSAA